MPANIAYLARVSQSQDLDTTYNPSTGITGANVPSEFKYNAGPTGSNETFATVVGANYFLPLYGYFKPGDIIYIYGNNSVFGYRTFFVVTSASVTVATLS